MFTGAKLTDQGASIQNWLLQNNLPLTFSKIKIGDGVYTGDKTKRTTMVSEKMEAPIEKKSNQYGFHTVRSTFSNESLANGFYVREIGIYVYFPLLSTDMLYAYDCVGDGIADYMPAAQSNFIIRQIIEESVEISNALEVTLSAAPTSIFVTFNDTATQSERGIMIPDDKYKLDSITKVEHGEWTPSFSIYSETGNISYSSRRGVFYRIGDLVYFTFRGSFNWNTAGFAAIYIEGLPYPSVPGYLAYDVGVTSMISNFPTPSMSGMSSRINVGTVTSNGSASGSISGVYNCVSN